MNDRATMQWLARNGVDLAPMTGTDRRTLLAVARIWDVYAAADFGGRAACAFAIRQLMHPECIQYKCVHAARQLIAASMDWSDVDRVWREVASAGHGGLRADLRGILPYTVTQLEAVR